MSSIRSIVERFPVSETVLQKKLEAKSAKVAVVGLGYVGLPLAVAVATAGFPVVGIDVNRKKTELVNAGANYIEDVNTTDLQTAVQQGRLYATDSFDVLNDVDVAVICVPTPLDRYKQPDLSFVLGATHEVAPRLHPGMLVVLESTTFPGTTEDVVLPRLEHTGLRCGVDFFLAFSPERVDPGNKTFRTSNTPRVVGGVTSTCSEVASLFYRAVLSSSVHQVSSPKVAEMEKILENTFRNINIALVNEMAIVCQKMGIDIWEVINAASTKPYGFMPFFPGPGIGGHCIPIDPFYMTWKAKEYDYHMRLVEAASEINDRMPYYVVDRIAGALNRSKKPLNDSSVLILGVAYKRDVEDWRESPALLVIEYLERQGASVEFHDPFVPCIQIRGEVRSSIPSIDDLGKYDIVVVITDHSCIDYEYVSRQAQLVFDARNCVPPNSPSVIKL